ncbi:MAG: PstS family phosphate ABC transporter substrate-binding protein [Methylotenera sp.]|uniref:PstS family phosphate ABC transporter substrate-binding protein n=1 Tax=Methylotenera sp. TaxID=2051956 RepID=UPI00271DAAF5|nr:PstS family phosphate ABC transporter substrate-binding protein [Methylotenera sp.]MDO9204767.1 PstS family phosphate ABC transporter substrate-binding protein [Methylotenera sp.]MDO9394781.1 PstS family phosphate ABC transporter substrate-binding protein [Methylotenera sp.]MDP1522199.1 PstS family phosphate ABC transporter substrate-binding protein [Methylotenera sp.]MDP3308712.1 PstS family phosphate ABC transporter substrate-binding protein [Methylotenera sp.]MDP3818846.1 PstS family pho
MNTTLTKSMTIAALVAATLSSTHALAADKIIKIDGSSTVYPISEAMAEEFQKATKIKVTVGESGTGSGFKKFCRGETDISDASRPIAQKEIDACKEAGIQFIELPIAFDALTVVVNTKNDWVKSLSVDELKKIWEPKSSIKNWKQVNAAYPDKAMPLFAPGTASGTFDYFTEAVNGKSKSSRTDFTPSEDDNVLVQGVAGNVGGLAYFGMAYYEENKDKLRAIPISAKAGGPAILPSVKTVEDGSYQPLARPIFIYVNATAAAFKPEVKAFVNFYLENAPKLVAEVKYVPLPTEDYDAVKAHFKAMKPGTGFGGKNEVGIKVKDLINRIK